MILAGFNTTFDVRDHRNRSESTTVRRYLWCWRARFFRVSRASEPSLNPGLCRAHTLISRWVCRGVYDITQTKVTKGQIAVQEPGRRLIRKPKNHLFRRNCHEVCYHLPIRCRRTIDEDFFYRGNNSNLHSKMSMKMWKILRHGNRVTTGWGVRQGLAKTARWLKRNRESANLHHETAPLC